MFSLISLFIACDKNSDEIIQNQETGIEYKTLSSSEVTLKNQLAEAAKIVTEISTDESVLAEIVATIKAQPRIMEDRVKFKDLMNPTEGLKSKVIGVETGKFASAFKSKLTSNGLKSASTLIEELSAQGIEINIPYPIEDYPEGVDVIVTSTPLDNYAENIGYIIGSGKEVVANQKLTETNPVIILWNSTKSEEEIKNYVSRCSESAKSSLSNEKSVSVTDPISMTEFANTSKGHRIYIDYIYCKNDHRPNLLFYGNSDIYFGAGKIEFSSETKIVQSPDGQGSTSVFNISLPPKYERYADNGYSQGFYPCNQVFLHDWQPAITSITWGAWVDTPSESATNTTTFSALAKITKGILEATGGITQVFSTTQATHDVLYSASLLPRSAYQDFYNSAGTVWGEVGETTFPVSGYGQRPVLQINSDLLYVTHWEVWSIN